MRNPGRQEKPELAKSIVLPLLLSCILGFLIKLREFGHSGWFVQAIRAAGGSSTRLSGSRIAWFFGTG